MYLNGLIDWTTAIAAKDWRTAVPLMYKHLFRESLLPIRYVYDGKRYYELKGKIKFDLWKRPWRLSS